MARHGAVSPLGSIDRLRRALAHAWRFSVVCIVIEPGSHREWLISLLGDWARAGAIAPLSVLRLLPGEHLWPLVVQCVGDNAETMGLLLTDLEPHVTDDQVAPGLAELNLFRNQLRDLLRGPLVLLVGERVADGLARALPDLYSWRATVCAISSEDVIAWRARHESAQVQSPPLSRPHRGVASKSMVRKLWTPGGPRTEHVYIVAAEYANEDFQSPYEVMKPFRGRKGGEVPKLTRLMEAASANALRELPHPACVTHLHGITMPDRRFATNELNDFYGFKPKLNLGDRCAMRMEVGTSNGGAVALASAWELLRGAREPGTALVLAAQTFEPDTNTREFVAEVIDSTERRAGLNMIPMGDLTMDAIVHLASSLSKVQNTLGDPKRTGEFLSKWSETKFKLAAEYHPSQHASSRDAFGNDLQGRMLRTRQIALASVGACAVVLTTDPKVVEHMLSRGDAATRRVVRIVGVGEGDAPISVSERDESIVFFRSFRQAFSNLRRSTRRSIDHLRAASFAVLHDAFPSIELAALIALGLSPLDIEQRVLSYWTNPYGGLAGMGHAFAASGLVQVAKTFHTMLRPQRFFRPSVEGSHHPEFHNASGPIHALTLSVGGPMSNAVAMLVESVPVASAASSEAHKEAEASPDSRVHQRADASTSPEWDRPVKLPARHDLAKSEQVPFEEKIFRVGSLNRAYALGLHEASTRDLGGRAKYGVLEARTLIRLDSVLSSMLPLFRSVDDWCTPASVSWGGSAVPLGALKADLAKLFTAPWPKENGGDAGLRKRIAALLDAAASAAMEARGIAAVRRESEAAELISEFRAAFGVPVGYFLVGALPDAPVIHQICLLVGADSPERFAIGDLVEIAPDAIPYARRSERKYPGLIPPWTARQDEEKSVAWTANAAEALTRAHEALRDADHYRALKLLYEAARVTIADVVAAPKRTPPRAFTELLRELVLNPDEDWEALRTCVQTLRRERATPPRGRVTLHCAFDLLDARRSSDLGVLRRRLGVVNQAIRRAEAWLEGTAAMHARVGDLFTVSAVVPGESWAQRWFPALSFARAVYQECLERGERVRAVVALGEGIPVTSIDGVETSPVSHMAFAVDTVNERASSRTFSNWFHGEAREGVIIALDAAMAREVADELATGAADDAAPAFEALWTLVGGEKLEAVDAKVGFTRVRYGTIPGDGSMPTVHYQLRARNRPEQAGPVEATQVIDNPVASARALLRELYSSARAVRRLAASVGFERLLPRIDFGGPPDDFWSDIIELVMNGAVAPHSGVAALIWLLEGATVEYPANTRITALLRLLREQASARPSSPPPKP